MNEGGFFTARLEGAPLYTPDFVPLLGEDCVIEVDRANDPVRARVEVSFDVSSAELLEESGAFAGFEVDPYDEMAVPRYRLELTLLPEAAAEYEGLLRSSDDPAADLLFATGGDRAHPPLAMIANYELEAWQVTTPGLPDDP